MCWHLTVAVPLDGVEHLLHALPENAPAKPETDEEVISAIGRGDKCFSIGVQCACDLYRKKGANPGQRIRHKAKREGWSESKLQRALLDTDDWSGIQPDLREALANVVAQCGQLSLFLFWTGSGGGNDVRDQRVIDANILRSNADVVRENVLTSVSDMQHERSMIV